MGCARAYALKRFTIIFVLALVALSLYGQGADAKGSAGGKTKAKTRAAQTRTVLPAPVLIPGTLPEMNAPGFWIGRHPYPDRIILKEDKILGFNEAVRRELRISYDIASFPAHVPGQGVRDALQKDVASVAGKRYYLSDEAPVEQAILNAVEKNMNTGEIPEGVAVRFGLIVKSADQRKLPAAERFHPGRYGRNFDMLQGSALPVGTPVAILHTAANGRWHYVTAPYSEGWVQDDKIAVCSREAVGAYLKNNGFVVVTSLAADLYHDRGLTAYEDRVKMGARLPFLGEQNGVVEISVPRRTGNGACTFSSAFLRRKDVNRGYLSYTPRNIIQQAFEFRNQPYGWGEMDGEQDCSSFIRSVFATVGLELPRNSSFQSRTGRQIAVFDAADPLQKRQETLRAEAVGGITLLGLKGHVMLYLGAVEGTPYAIHAMWSYNETAGKQEFSRVVSRVVVTSLLLGKGSRHGSLLERTVTAQLLAK